MTSFFNIPKQTINRLIATFTSFVTVIIALSGAVPSYSLHPNDINAQSAYVMDMDTGEVVFEKNPDKKSYPASTTKILTALMILEKFRPTDSITIDGESPFTTGSRIFIIEGEVFSVEQLLHALLLESANDVALALAKAHSGSIEKFAEAMNKRAKELGATQTHFKNPNGLHDPQHVTTAKDLAIITEAAMKNTLFAKIVKTASYTLPPTNKQTEPRPLFNGNKFLIGSANSGSIPYKGQMIPIDYASVIGVKTGYTEKAGQCFVTAIEKNGKRFIVVILGATGNYLYIDSRTLMDYATDESERKEILPKNGLAGKVSIAGGQKISAYARQSIALYIPKGSVAKIETVLTPKSGLKLPIDSTKPIATLVINVDGKKIAEHPLFSAGSITADGVLSKQTKSFNEPEWKNPWFWAINGGKLLAALILWRIIMTWFNSTAKRVKRIMKRYTA